MITRAPSLPDIVDASFNQIRQHARSDAAVTIRLLETIAIVAHGVSAPDDRAALQRHVVMIARGARDGLPEAEDRKVVAERYQAALGVLSESTGTSNAPAS